MKLDKIISGGQNGVDQAALRAARRLGISTGGWAPRNWLTLEGPKRELLQGFGLVEDAGGYASRTENNVRVSDATLRIASDFKSAGELCTKRAVKLYQRPCFDVLVNKRADISLYWHTVIELRAFLDRHGVRVLNVAGNSEQTSPGIGAIAEAFLIEALI